MLRFSNPLQQPAIRRIAGAEMTGAASRLEYRFEVVQHQQATVFAQHMQQQRYLVLYLLRQVEMMLMRDKTDALLQEEIERQGVLQRTPEDILKVQLHMHN